MDSNVFDVFQSVKNLLYIGNYHDSYEEACKMDINEEDASQVVRRYFYIFINSIEDQKMDDLNEFLNSLKVIEDDQIKIYYTIFLFLTIYLVKNQFSEQRFNKIFNDLKSIKKYDPILFPAVYIISLMLIDRNEFQNFLDLIEKFESDPEILLLKYYLLLKMNRLEELENLIDLINIKDPESVQAHLFTIILNLYKNNDYDSAIKTLQQLNKSNKITVKMFNLIGLSLMSKGAFEEASKALSLGKDAAEKNGIAMRDYNTILVNLICCFRNLNNEDEVRNCEEILRKCDPKNTYFRKLTQFDEDFNQAIA
jgi:hypothetical protein